MSTKKGKAINQVELDEILEKHRRYLNKEKGGEIADFRHREICGLKLSGLDLRYAKLSYSKIDNCDFHDSDMRHVKMDNSSIKMSNFDYTDSRWTSIQDAKIFNCSFQTCNLTKSFFCRSEMKDIFFDYSTMKMSNFYRTNLANISFRRTNLEDTIFTNAYLCGCDFRNTILCDAMFGRAILADIRIPSVTMMLQCDWGNLSDKLTALCMKFDAFCHPNPGRFDRWANGDGICPFADINIQRAVNFVERKECWNMDTPKISAYELMSMILKEKCRGWNG